MNQRRSDIEQAAEILTGDDHIHLDRYRQVVRARMARRPECDVLDWAIKTSAWRHPQIA